MKIPNVLRKSDSNLLPEQDSNLREQNQNL